MFKHFDGHLRNGNTIGESADCKRAPDEQTPPRQVNNAIAANQQTGGMFGLGNVSMMMLRPSKIRTRPWNRYGTGYFRALKNSGESAEAAANKTRR